MMHHVEAGLSSFLFLQGFYLLVAEFQDRGATEADHVIVMAMTKDVLV